ncbi:MAG: hypothetical protein HUK08_02150 [Bacteroidaceae bacterium]|nr:hypothetical protein [Bacteroidaceae bacterium]
MPRLLILFLFLLTTQVKTAAQIVDGEATDKTLFHEFMPAKITLTSGKMNHQKEANIFLKNGRLLYKSDGKVMTANMEQIFSVEIDKRLFINTEGKLGEVIERCPGGLLLVVRIVNADRLTQQLINESSVTNINFNGQFNITRDLPPEEQMRFPIDDLYYFVIDGKTMRAEEPSVRRFAGKKKMEECRKIIAGKGFRWNDRQWLKQIMEVLAAEAR